MKYPTRLKANIITLNAKPDSVIKDEILKHHKNGMLSFAEAFKISENSKSQSVT